ncbi:HdeD family acid-resistance protein [Rhizobium tumorigenes]|uniref:HdeD family acid-resistance protein n=1 Tax=Rhizobium tumorigenes TaxID=2041385 RepID=A0AAF1K6X3_9HYPH|nr:HdeD family acid-resistance protein [Rhizobium tumorigenes]WFR97393.1 HdeD family acid-resistance protein [Rhizobium tumorigenes]
MVMGLNELPHASAHAKWGWFVALGVLLLLLSGIAFGNLFVATVVSVYYVGMLMLLGGIVYLIHAFQVRGWEHSMPWILSGLLYTLAGIFAFMNPLPASAVFTLMLAIALVIAGVLRIWVGRRMKPAKGWGFILLSGIVTMVAGFVVALGWPVNSLWILGLFLAVDLMFQGWTLIAFGLGLRR